MKGDDRVDFVDMVRAVPEHSREVVGVWRVVHFDLVTESPMFGESVHFPFVIHHLVENKEKHNKNILRIWKKGFQDNNSVTQNCL